MKPLARPSADQTKPLSVGKWKRRLLKTLALLVILLILAPVLVARTPLRNWLLARAVPELQGEVRIGGASLWWLSPPVFTDIEVRDHAGRTLLHIPRLEGSKSLVALLSQPLDLGEFRLMQPALHVVCTRDSTNLEAVLAYWLQKKETPRDSTLSEEGIAARAELVQASLVLEDQDSGRKWSLDPADLTLAVPRDRRMPLQFKLKATVADERRTGRLTADLSAHLVATNAGPRLCAEGELHAEDVPLDAAEPLLRRLEANTKLGGWLNAHVKVQAGDGQPGTPDMRLEGNVTLQALALTTPVLGPDMLRLSRVEAPCRVTLDGQRLLVEQLDVQAEVGKVRLAGTVDRTKDLAGSLNQPGYRLEAELDLARLAALLPNTLHLSKDTQIQSGTIAVHLRSTLRGESVLWEGDLHTSDLEGQYQGQRLTWKEPFAADFTAHQEAGALWPMFERFRCASDFLRLEMSGSLDDWTARGSFNLGRLREHLAGFVELGTLTVQGEGTVQAAGRRNPRGGHRLESDLQLAQLKLADGGRVCREENIRVHLDLVGEVSPLGLRINAGGLHVLAGKDGVDLDLLEPLTDFQSFRAARGRVRVHGDLTRWQGRLASLLGLFEDVRMAGQFEMDGRFRYAAEAVQLEDIKVAGHGVQVQGFGVNVNEPSLDLTTSGRWLPARETLELQHTRLGCSTLSVQAPMVTFATDRAGAWQITTSATVQGDVARLHRCLLALPPNTPDTYSGALAGRIDLRPDEGRQVVQLDLNVQNLVVGSPAAPVWREARINLTGHGVYDLLKDSFQIAQLHLDSPSLGCDATGRLTALRSDMQLSLDGKINYDLEKLEPQLRPYLGQNVKLTGRDSRSFHLAGSLATAGEKPLNLVAGPSFSPPPAGLLGRLQGEAGLNWQTVQALGCQVGPAELRGQLASGWLRTAPIEATFNQGRLRLEPSLRLDPLPLEVTLAKGRLIDHAHLTPAACASALGYALPVLADVAQADGELSLDLDNGQVPLTEPTRAEMTGRLIIHSAQVSAGPLVRELSVLLKGPATLTLAKDNVVPFQVAKGRVYHRGLELHFPELTVRTSGSVGLDGSLALVAEMPVPPKWLGSSRLARAVAGQTIRLPIGGTLSKPKLDEQALRTASAQFARDAAESAIRQELDGKLKNEAESGLKKLFRRK